MAAKSSTFDNQLLALIFNGSGIANVADNAATAPLANLYLALHTASPDAGGNQATNEATYAGYARIAVARSSAGFTVSGSSAALASTVNFPAATAGSETETYFSVGTSSSGAGEILYFGPITPNIIISNGVTPQLTTGTTITES